MFWQRPACCTATSCEEVQGNSVFPVKTFLKCPVLNSLEMSSFCCFHSCLFCRIVSGLSGGQGNAETQPERRLRGQIPQKGRTSVPSRLLFLQQSFCGIGTEAINLRGFGGQRPPFDVNVMVWLLLFSLLV